MNTLNQYKCLDGTIICIKIFVSKNNIYIKRLSYAFKGINGLRLVISFNLGVVANISCWDTLHIINCIYWFDIRNSYFEFKWWLNRYFSPSFDNRYIFKNKLFLGIASYLFPKGELHHLVWMQKGLKQKEAPGKHNHNSWTSHYNILCTKIHIC